MKITPGKQKGMKAVSDARGVIAAAAMDQRGSLKSAIAKEKGIDSATLVSARLAPDMLPLSGQYQRVTDTAKLAVARLTGEPLVM